MPYLEFRGIKKCFPGVRALGGVSFEIERGSCHALIGENGAGKSTLGKILAGVHTADDGEIYLEGKVIRPGSPRAARELGIAMVHQELAFCPNLSIAENLCLGDLPRNRLGWVDKVSLRVRALEMLESIHARLDPDRLIETLSTGQEQMVQIAAAVGTGASILVMDEPTSSLSAGEAVDFFALVRQLRQRGITIIYVSHRMEELFALCDSITVLRDGMHVSTGPIARTSQSKVVSEMIGRELLIQEPEYLRKSPGKVMLDVRNLSNQSRFRNVSLQVRAGEVVGLAGLVGAGRSELAMGLMGLDRTVSGEVFIGEKPLQLGRIEASLEAGLGLLPEDRKRQGLILGLNCRENVTLAALDLVSANGVLANKSECRVAVEFSRRLHVKVPNVETRVSVLSGGNQQKIALAKWLFRNCDVLMIDEPTRGVDVGAKAEIYTLIDSLACEGRAVLLISSELPELMGLCAKILVMRDGEIVGISERHQFTEERLLRMMTGLGPAARP